MTCVKFTKVVITLAIIISIAFSQNFAKSIKVVYFHDFPPYSWIENGEMKGVYIDIAQELFSKRLGLSIEHKGYPWERAQKMVENGEADVFVTTKTPERLIYSISTEEAVYSMKVMAYTYTDNPFTNELKKISDLKGFDKFTICDYIGNGWAKYNLAELSNIYWAADMQSCVRLLIEKKVDIHFSSPLLMKYLKKRMNAEKEILELPYEFQTIPIYVFVSKKSLYSNDLPFITKHIRSMITDGTMKTIIRRYE